MPEPLLCPEHKSLAQKVDEIHSDVKEMRTDVAAIFKTLGGGKVQFATLGLRTRALEVIVYGGASLALMAVCGAVLARALGVPVIAP